MTTRLIMHGAAGRMGRTILGLAAEDPAYTIVAGVDRETGSLSALGLRSTAPLLTTLPSEPGAVVIDFSHVSATPGVIAHCASKGMPLAIGTTGHDPVRIQALLAEAGSKIPILLAANMSVGVNLVIQVAASIARSLGLDYDIELVEAHHHHKVDAPSGTALAIADAVCAATNRTRSDLVHGREGQTGARRRGEIGMHALRMGDVVGDHHIHFVGNGERVVLGHVAHTRDIFARGALRAAAFLATAKPGVHTMREVIGL